MFAIYPLSSHPQGHQSIGLSASHFAYRVGRQAGRVALDDLRHVALEKRRKLAPLIAGGIITSLSLLSMVLYAASLEVFALAGAGLLLTYYGIQEYPVLVLEHGHQTTLLWLPARVELPAFRPLVALVEYRVAKGYFPLLYAADGNPEASPPVHDESRPVRAGRPLKYAFAPVAELGGPPVAVQPERLDSPVLIAGTGPLIGYSHYLINRPALAADHSVSFS